ncbi:hypothetical protein [Belnapia mucosa]|nr:hypothetical protein [Belnapia mucosa]
MVDSQPPPPPRRPLSQRLQPWAEFLYKMIVASAAAIAIWKGLR